ncbi:fatty acid-binding protein homolog 9 [Octopus bimaculoides]|uniref:Fatty acid-binding protein homolog 9 n=2 Tax=Octopus TaxID=6643 RepID=A0A6P7T019_9MOLL|nr:fatty acid-binding protein homolog 9 [Octopus bimaculoides]XP_029643722.1 fatty acid-binding protein homolog 9 [Octopus sinensis]ATY46523.1 putative fatty acid-binding protein 9 [Octopus vulgaris]|eukprot:XP_014769109.1 PREDICTED: fatty acid-binding protein homolog 9-like [Octopus bimaculoides]
MSLNGFIGKWQEQTKEGFDSLISAIGLPAEKKEWYRAARTEIEYKKLSDDTWEINVGIVGVPKGRTFKFKFGQTYESASIDGSPMQSIITADGDKFVEKHTGESLQGAEMHIIRRIENGNMIVKTTCNGATMNSRYTRV